MLVLFGTLLLVLLVAVCADWWHKGKVIAKYGSNDFVPYFPLIGSSYLPMRKG